MLITQRGFALFSNYDLSALLEGQLSQVRNKVESDQTILSPTFDERKYIADIIKQFRINPIVIHIDKITVSQVDANIPGNRFPNNFFVEPNQTYTKPVIIFRLPFEGEQKLLQSLPSTRLLWSETVAIEGNKIIFELINFSNNAEQLKNEKEQFLKNLQQQVSYINKDIENYETKLETIARESISRGKTKLKAQEDVLKALGNPEN